MTGPVSIFFLARISSAFQEVWLSNFTQAQRPSTLDTSYSQSDTPSLLVSGPDVRLLGHVCCSCNTCEAPRELFRLPEARQPNASGRNENTGPQTLPRQQP